MNGTIYNFDIIRNVTNVDGTNTFLSWVASDFLRDLDITRVT